MNKLLYLVLLVTPLLANTAAGAGEAVELRDPTRPLGFRVAEASRPELKLQALFQRASGAEAIVNGQSVRVGDTVAGAKIESISRSGIMYSWQGQRQALTLRPSMPGIKENP